jgi:hypothetical protein
MMKTPLEDRVARLEAEVEKLRRPQPALVSEKPWWERVQGMFKDSPNFDEATRLGREYRESLKPKEDTTLPEAI